jgi:hypothetical protein
MRAADLATPGPLKHAYQLFNASKSVRVRRGGAAAAAPRGCAVRTLVV